MRITALIIVLAAALVAGVMFLTPLGESQASGYMWPQTSYNQYQPYSGYPGQNYGYSMPSYNVPAGWTVSCPTGYVWTGSVCLWQGAMYGMGGGYGFDFFGGPYGYGGGFGGGYDSPTFYNARFFDAEFDDDFDDVNSPIVLIYSFCLLL